MLLGEGDDSAAWSAGGAWVVRLAKHAPAAEGLRREACFLPGIADRLPLSIPRPTYHRVADDLHASVHRLVHGEALTRDRFLSLEASARKRCARQVAEFLVALQRIDPRIAERCGIERLDHVAYYRDARVHAETHVFPHLTPADRAWAESLFESFSPPVASEEPVVLHHDLGPEHVLWNPARQAVVGILDFGDMTIGERARDLVLLWEDYGLEFVRDFLRGFPSPDPARLLQRMYRIYELAAVEWASWIASGERAGDLREILGTIAELRSNARAEPWREAL